MTAPARIMFIITSAVTAMVLAARLRTCARTKFWFMVCAFCPAKLAELVSPIGGSGSPGTRPGSFAVVLLPIRRHQDEQRYQQQQHEQAADAGV